MRVLVVEMKHRLELVKIDFEASLFLDFTLGCLFRAFTRPLYLAASVEEAAGQRPLAGPVDIANEEHITVVEDGNGRSERVRTVDKSCRAANRANLS